MLKKSKRIFVLGANNTVGDIFLGKLIKSNWITYSLEKSRYSETRFTEIHDLPNKLNFDQLDAIVCLQGYGEMNKNLMDIYKTSVQLWELASTCLVK